jgi:HD-like signal output (HDOD) protein
VIVKINKILENDNHSMNDIAKTVQHDISLSVRIVQIANSPALRTDHEIRSIYDAISRLGVSLVKNLAICVSFKDKLGSRNSLSSRMLTHELNQSFERSVYGCVFAEDVPGVSTQAMLMAGLVGRIGHIAVMRYLNDTDPYKDMLPTQTSAIAEEIGPAISDMILTKWEFPKEVREAITSNEPVNLVNPATAHDVYMFTNAYLNDDLPSALRLRAEDTLTLHKEKLEELKSLFA